MFLEETYIGAVDQEVCSHIEEPSLLLDAAPEVDSCPDTRSTSFLENGFAGFQKDGLVISFGYAETTGEIVRANEQSIQTGTARISSKASIAGLLSMLTNISLCSAPFDT